MRIGTWNLAGRWNAGHESLIRQQDCDVWLLTEVSPKLALQDYTIHRTESQIVPGRSWAAVMSREPLKAYSDPHPASALAGVGDFTFCSSILPWRNCSSRPPWIGARHVDKTERTVADLLRVLPKQGLIWGGDWNHALSGEEKTGTKGGRSFVLRAIDALGLAVPTASLARGNPELLTIDHIAVSRAAIVQEAKHVEAIVNGQRLSDHDAYVVDVRLP